MTPRNALCTGGPSPATYGGFQRGWSSLLGKAAKAAKTAKLATACFRRPAAKTAKAAKTANLGDIERGTIGQREGPTLLWRVLVQRWS